MLANDLDKFNFLALLLPFAWVGPLQTLASLLLLRELLGWACLAPLPLIGALLPAQLLLSGAFARARARITRLADQRLELLAETLGSLRIIKLYAWERPIQRQLDGTRARESLIINR